MKDERSSHTLTVKDVMTENVITIESEENVKKSAYVMGINEIGCLVVEENDEIIGMVTESDLIKKVIAAGKNPEETKVKDVMSTPPVIVKPEHSLEDAIRQMFKHNIKKLIVVGGEGKKNKLVGLVTLTDIARIEPTLINLLYSLYIAKKESPPKRIEKVIHYYIV